MIEYNDVITLPDKPFNEWTQSEIDSVPDDYFLMLCMGAVYRLGENTGGGRLLISAVNRIKRYLDG